MAEFRDQVGINEALRQALSIAENCGFTREQLAHDDRFWDAVRIERSLLRGRFAEGKAETLLETAVGMTAAGIAAETIARITGLPMARIGQL